MRTAFLALAEGLRAPWRRCGLVSILWLARLLPILLVFALPAFERAHARSAHHPDAARLLDPGSDASGFGFAWLSDFGRSEMSGAPDTLFWLVVLAWLTVTVLAGGIVSRLLPNAANWPPFLPQCGRYAGRFLRLALLVLLLVYAFDVWINAFLAKAHEKAVLNEHLEDLKVQRNLARGLLLVTVLHLLGLVHAYARIDIVANDRRSSVLSFLRGLGTLVVRLPSLFLVEVGMLLATGAAILLAWLVTKKVLQPRADSTWIALGLFLAFLALFDYLRTGLEVGAMAARCRLLGPPPPPEPPPEPLDVETTDDLPPIPLPNA